MTTNLRTISVSRRPVTSDWNALITSRNWAVESPILRVVEAAMPGVDLAQWGRDVSSLLAETLPWHGAVLFRGFQVNTPERLDAVIRSVSGDPVDYRTRSTPRSRVAGNIFTSTEYPADQTIPMHNEMSYTRSWPGKVFFSCVTAAPVGGETPLADSRRVYHAIPTEIRQRFEASGVMYVRRFADGVDLPWSDVFQTDDRHEVDRQCAEGGMQCVWDGDRLTTRQTCQAVTVHPRTGDKVWFNQAHLFHVSSLPTAVRDALVASFGADHLPRNAYYGDGSPIEDETLAEIRRAYAAHTLTFPWREGDLLVVDNILTAHGRMPFAGPRRILVGMSELEAPAAAFRAH